MENLKSLREHAQTLGYQIAELRQQEKAEKVPAKKKSLQAQINELSQARKELLKFIRTSSPHDYEFPYLLFSKTWNTEPIPEPEPEPISESGFVPEPIIEHDPEPEPEPNTGTDLESEPIIDPEPEPEPEPNTGTDQEPETNTEPELVPEKKTFWKKIAGYTRKFLETFYD